MQTLNPIHRRDGQVQILIEQRRQRTKRALPRPPKPRSIKPLQLRYFSLLREIVVSIRDILEERLLPYVASIIAEAKLTRPRGDGRRDSYDDTIQRILALAKTQLLRQYPERFYRDIATRVASSTNDLNLDNINRTFKKLFGAEYSRFEPWLTQEVKSFVTGNVKLISSISTEYFDRVERVVLRGAQAGKLAKDVSADIKAQFGVSERRAAFIARDQISKFNGDLTQLRQTQAGINQYEWSTSEDERVRATHAANNGKVFAWSDPPETGHPGDGFNCRCVAIPVLEK